MKAAIIILSDPNSGDDALGRVFNALATAYDYQQQGDEVTILFQGAGTRWIGKLSKADHPVHALFEAVKESVAGISCGCAEVFGATEEVEKSAFDFIRDNKVPGTAGLPSLRNLASEGHTILTLKRRFCVGWWRTTNTGLRLSFIVFSQSAKGLPGDHIMTISPPITQEN